MSAHSRTGAKLGLAILIVVAVAVHAIALFQISKRLVMPAAATAIVLAVAAHVGAGRWLARRIGALRRNR